MSLKEILSVSKGDFTKVIDPIKNVLSNLKAALKETDEAFTSTGGASGAATTALNAVKTAREKLGDDDFRQKADPKKGTEQGKLFGKEKTVEKDLKSMEDFLNKVNKLPNILQKVFDELKEAYSVINSGLATYETNAQNIESALLIKHPSGTPSF